MGYAWYVATTKPFSEFVAEENLQRQGFQPFNPVCSVTRIERGARVTKTKPYLPGYIFVRFDRLVQPWQRINNTRGVEALLPRMGTETGEPGEVRERAMRVLQQKCIGSSVLPEHVDVALSQIIPEGATIRITAGAFVGFEAPVKWSHEDRVKVIVSLFGRPTPVKLERSQVELVA